jgi:hypothetical protein
MPDVRHLGLRLLAAANWHATAMFLSGVFFGIPEIMARSFSRRVCAILLKILFAGYDLCKHSLNGAYAIVPL